jgi:hypothetical protein
VITLTRDNIKRLSLYHNNKEFQTIRHFFIGTTKDRGLFLTLFNGEMLQQRLTFYWDNKMRIADEQTRGEDSSRRTKKTDFI